MDIQRKIMWMEKWPSSSNLTCTDKAKKLADHFLVGHFLLISLRRVKLKPQVRAQTIGNVLL